MPPIDFELFLFDLLGFCLCHGLLDLSVSALTAFLNCVCHGSSNQANCADSVIVCGNDIVDLIGIAVGVNDCNDGDVESKPEFSPLPDMNEELK